MTEDKLYFNGITPDGHYALEPQTAQQLAGRIRSSRDREAKLAERLAQAFKSAGKVQDIVDFLVVESLAMLEGRAATREMWLEALARQLLETLLGEESAGIGNVQELARKLEQDPHEKVASIVAAFLKPGVGQSQELTALLLPQKSAETFDFKAALKHRTLTLGGAIRNDLLGAKMAAELAANPDSRSTWLDNLVRQLKELPIESLKALTESRSIVSEPLKRLVPALRDAGSARLAPLIQDLEPLSTKGKYASWPTMVDVLDRDLRGIVADTASPDLWELLLGALTLWIDKLLEAVGHLGYVPSVDPKRLETSGWGVIFPADMAEARLDAIKAALKPLLDRREKLATQEKPLYQVYDGGKGYRPGEDARAFLSRLGTDPSQPADPEKTGVPYYLLLVGSPVEIPFEFQYALDVQYAVGRIDFDRIEDYATYARSIVAAEQADFALAPEVVFVPIENPCDEATKLSAQNLVKPISEHLTARVTDKAWSASSQAWNITVVPPEATTRAKLLDVVRRDNAPALLFTASHGMQFMPDDVIEQQANQGALVCADWQGPETPVLPEYYLSGAALAAQDDVNLLGTIAFLFACYGAGTPRTDDYYRQDFEDKGKMIAEEPFVAALPKAMLSLVNGGALAVVGHVERVWSLSYLGPEQRSGLGEPRRDEHLGVFKGALEQLLQGYPVGAAMEYFAMRYAALSTELTAAFDAFTEPDDYQVAELWTANHDARGYVIIGDPAVRLKVAPTIAEATPRKDLI